jgi:hypothetical protein
MNEIMSMIKEIFIDIKRLKKYMAQMVKSNLVKEKQFINLKLVNYKLLKERHLEVEIYA